MCEKCVKPPVVPSVGSRRRRLWDLPHNSHCPVIGVCLPLATLRQLVKKALGGRALADDYEVHVGAVAECAQRNRLSEALQAELERRYALKVQACRAIKTSRELADMWAQAVHLGDVAGAFWAALTHPRCDEVLQELLLRDMHMVQHQAGAAVRIDVARFKQVVSDKEQLAKELVRVQERSARALADKTSEAEALAAQVAQWRAQVVADEVRVAHLTQALVALKARLPEYESAQRLQKKLDQALDRQRALESTNADLRQRLASEVRRCEESVRPGCAVTCAPTQPQAGSLTVQLQHKTVLCVGGRNGSVANYREVIERVGARFVHHDGGIEDNQSVLDAGLAAADLVVCQTGCISHNAYWRVKDFCKRNGKRCVFVESPSASALARGLEQAMSVEEPSIV